MPPEELLEPRYEILTAWPAGTWDEGTILLAHQVDGEMYSKECGWSSRAKSITLKDMDKYPKIFGKMKWHEKRKIEDMPRFIKSWDKPVNHDKELANVVIECGVDNFWSGVNFGVDESGFVKSYSGILIDAFMPHPYKK